MCVCMIYSYPFSLIIAVDWQYPISGDDDTGMYVCVYSWKQYIYIYIYIYIYVYMYVYTQGYIKINTNNRYKIAVYLLCHVHVQQ